MTASNPSPRFKRPQHPHGQDDELLTTDQVAELTHICVATLRYKRHIGNGPRSFRLGRRVMYWLSDVLTWIDHQYDTDRPSARTAPPSVSQRRPSGRVTAT